MSGSFFHDKNILDSLTIFISFLLTVVERKLAQLRQSTCDFWSEVLRARSRVGATLRNQQECTSDQVHYGIEM